MSISYNPTAGQIRTIAGQTEVYDGNIWVPVTTGGYAAGTISSIGAGSGAGSSVYSTHLANTISANTIRAAGSAYSTNWPGAAFNIMGDDGTIIVSMDGKGNVSWPRGENISAAAAAFGKAIRISVEHQAGINAAVRARMRDTLFKEIIDIAKQKGSLTADDLTYMLAASKIMEKLAGTDIES